MEFRPYNSTVSIGSLIALVVFLLAIAFSPVAMNVLDGRTALLIGLLALARLL